MATYNGENFIRQQLESIINQSYQEFMIYICDDCSTDSTVSIINEFYQKYPDKICIEETEQNTGAAKVNFINMMLKYKADYVMLCDQDDIWLSNKIELTLKRMQDAELNFGKETPILIHTDLTVVNTQLEIINHSYRKMIDVDYSRKALKQALVQNIVTGCTVMYNKSLSNLLNSVPSNMCMHDWWLFLIASAFGKIESVEEVTVLYRQHFSNSVGAIDSKESKYRISRLLNNKQYKQDMLATYMQASSFYSEFCTKMSDQQLSLVKEYINIPSLPWIMRVMTILKLGTLKKGVLRNIANIILM